jgi:hypothetical protein
MLNFDQASLSWGNPGLLTEHIIRSYLLPVGRLQSQALPD